MMMNDSRPLLRLGHSPDPDDAFMWWPLFALNGAAPRLDGGRFRFEPVPADIEMLNQRASAAGDLEITAMSCAQYPFVKDRYALTACGSSMGDHYGPKLISRNPMTLEDLKRHDIVVAVPGERTSAFTTVNLMLGKGAFRHTVMPFDQIIECVASGECAAGLIIHEGQLTYQHAGLHLIADLGAWWSQTYELPLPLGVNAVRRDLEQRYGPGTLREITTTLLRSVEYALAHRTESVEYALQFARDMGAEVADRFITMYVNSWTLDFGEAGRRGVRTFLQRAYQEGITPDPGEVDFISPAAATPHVEPSTI